jgi:GNAT superfamily N-acetyltransferase
MDGAAMTDTTRGTADESISVVPANEASWDDLQTVLGTRGYPARCQCQWFKFRDMEFHTIPVEERAERLRAQTGSVTCFVTRLGFRRRGVTYALARATVDFARERGARALEGYPMITQPDQEITWGELHVGSRSVFAAAGFVEVSRPTLRRVVMRIDFPVDDG